jgi:hypothetical protein
VPQQLQVDQVVNLFRIRFRPGMDLFIDPLLQRDKRTGAGTPEPQTSATAAVPSRTPTARCDRPRWWPCAMMSVRSILSLSSNLAWPTRCTCCWSTTPACSWSMAWAERLAAVDKWMNVYDTRRRHSVTGMLSSMVCDRSLNTAIQAA